MKSVTPKDLLPLHEIEQTLRRVTGLQRVEGKIAAAAGGGAHPRRATNRGAGGFLLKERVGQRRGWQGGTGKDVVPINDPSGLHDVGTLAQLMRLSPTPQGARRWRAACHDRKVIQAPSSGGHVLEVKVKEAADEAEPDGAAPRRQGLRDGTIKEILKLNPSFKLNPSC